MTNDARWSYTWDAENRVVRLESRSNTPQASWRRVEWTYDAKGRRIGQKTSLWTNSTWVVVEDLKFISDPMSVGRQIAELNATNNSLIRSYVWGLDLSGSLDGAGGVGGLLWVRQHSGSAAGVHYCAYDGNGNVVGLVSANTGTETARYEYAPFGEPIRVTGPAARSNPFRFSTKRTDNTTDFVLYEYRAYGPTIGRWLSRDSLLADAAFSPETARLEPEVLIGALPTEVPNLYGFVRQAPVNWVDGFGLFSANPADIPCLAAHLGVGKCCSARFTGKLEIEKFDTFLADVEFRIETRWAVERCMYCCGDKTKINIDFRGGGEFRVHLGRLPKPVPIVIRFFGGASVGGALVVNIDGCTGQKKASGCKFLTARFGVEGCATYGFGEVCLRGEANYTNRQCHDPALNSSCLAGRGLLRFKFLWRTWDYVFWQTAPCETN